MVDKNLYPEGHPYSWQVIGSLKDLQNATLQDVKNFYHRWYVPNNTTLVIAGDFNSVQAKEWVRTYFDEIPRGEEIEPLADQPSTLKKTRKLYYEGNFARLPELRMVWPVVDIYHDDAYALDILTQLLSDGKKAPLYQVLVEEKELTSNVFMRSGNSEIAGEISLITRAFPGTNLNEVEATVNSAFSRFEEEEFSDDDLNRIKAGIETDFYNGLSSVLGKAFQLAQYNIFAGDPSYINEDIQKTMAVTREDVMRVYEQYIKNRPFVATSFVPHGQIGLILDNSAEATVEEEVIVAAGRGEQFDIPEETEYERTPSSFDRTVEPPYGETPAPAIPDVWQARLANGLGIYGIENRELPLVEFEISLDGGLLLESQENVGVSNLMATLLTKGTANKTPEELEEAIDLLGASINVRAGRQSITIRGNSLARNYKETLALVDEIILEPRWDQREFELAKQSALSEIAQQSANPNTIASNTFNKLLYGDGHILSFNPIGTTNTVGGITLDDLKAYYSTNFSP